MRALLSICLLFFVPTVALCATDPNVDPASPLPIDAFVEGAELDVVNAEAFLQESAEGLTYVRVDLEVVNTGSESVHDHAWEVDVDGVVAYIMTSGTIEPGEQRLFSKLIMGGGISPFAGGQPPVTVAVSSPQVSLPCSIMTQLNSFAACQQITARIGGLCRGKCISGGFAGGEQACLSRHYTDGSGITCQVWYSECVCEGRPTLSEGLAEELFDPNDPLLGDIVVNPPWVESRPYP